ncbi:hypothetical protein [Streptomyces sp. NPDC047985]|uniref:hypothetical protein n=1 Tax=unclassified Streptomyces TaxID=2593676 RepID=UPI00344A4418
MSSSCAGTTPCKALLGVLDGRTTYRIDERTLALASENDASLGAAAAEPGE